MGILTEKLAVCLTPRMQGEIVAMYNEKINRSTNFGEALELFGSLSRIQDEWEQARNRALREELKRQGG